jgi:hypothetical protein
MKKLLRLLTAALCTGAAGVQAASLSFSSAIRSVGGADALEKPATEFADFDASVTGIVFDPGLGGLREGCRASQQSVLGAQTITVLSEISGDSGTGVSLFHVSFRLDHAAAWSLAGTMSLLGTAGFACVSFQDLAHQDTLLINEIIFAPPRASESRPLFFSGVLEPGSYMLEAMVYGGGDNLPTLGELNVVFSIPEPGSLTLMGIALVARRRRAQ